MPRTTAILILFLAATLEAGGDAIMRAGLHRALLWQKISLFSLAGLVYSLTGGLSWDFGKLLGLYVVFFLLTAQAISWLFFKQVPSFSIVVGGMFIVAGGMIISIAKP
jgi:hypothetical protein